MIRHRLLTVALSLGLALAQAGCASPRLRVTEIPIAKGATFDLLSPASLGQEISLEQIVEARYGDKSFSFHCLLEVDPQQLVLVGMTPFNTRAFTLTLKDQELTVDIAPGAQLPAEPSRILADLQLALWPELPQARGLEGDVVLQGMQPGSGGRVFSRGDKHVIHILYEDSAERRGTAPWDGRIVFRHLEENYTLVVRTVRAEKLEP